MKRLLPLTLALLLLMPINAHAQLDAIIDAVVDAVEPQPVYDTGLREATEVLAGKIDRLNRVLFGGAEEASAAYRYRTMYSDLYDLTTTFSSFVDRTYGNAKRLERMYDSLGDAFPGDAARAVQATWYAYDNTVRTGSRIVAQFKKVFSDPNTTNAEVRQASRDALEALAREQKAEDKRIGEEIAAVQLAAGLVECERFMEASAETYVSEGKRIYGTTVSTGGSSSVAGTLGTAVIVILALLCTVYGAFAGIHVMKGDPSSERLIARLLILLAFSVTVILAVQNSI